MASSSFPMKASATAISLREGGEGSGGKRATRRATTGEGEEEMAGDARYNAMLTF